jgi:hypothetical protein
MRTIKEIQNDMADLEAKKERCKTRIHSLEQEVKAAEAKAVEGLLADVQDRTTHQNVIRLKEEGQTLRKALDGLAEQEKALQSELVLSDLYGQVEEYKEHESKFLSRSQGLLNRVRDINKQVEALKPLVERFTKLEPPSESLARLWKEIKAQGLSVAAFMNGEARPGDPTQDNAFVDSEIKRLRSIGEDLVRPDLKSSVADISNRLDRNRRVASELRSLRLEPKKPTIRRERETHISFNAEKISPLSSLGGIAFVEARRKNPAAKLSDFVTG